MSSTTLTYTASEGARIAHAVGRQKNLKDSNGVPRDATAAEAKAWLVETLRLFVKRIEQQEAEQAAAAVVTEIAPT